MNNLLFVLTLCAALGCGLMAGVFFAFSTFIMRALARLQPARGIEAMQSINRTVINPWFLGVFLGTAAVCILLAGASLWRWQQPGVLFRGQSKNANHYPIHLMIFTLTPNNSACGVMMCPVGL